MKADEKECPRCAEIIKARARECRFCGYVFAPLPDMSTPAPSPSISAPISPTPASSASVAIQAEGVLDLLSALVEKSLVVYEEDAEGNGRYRLLETVRQYGREKLELSEEAKALRSRHQDWYLAFAEQADPKLSGPEQGIWLERLESEHDNLRAALAWSLEEGKREQGKGKREEEAKQEQREEEPSFPFSLPSFPSLETGLRLCGALQRFWWVRGHLGEGRAWCAAVLAAEGAFGRTAARAKALNGVGTLAAYQSDYAAARTYFQESLAIRQEMGDKQGIANSLLNLGNVAWYQGDNASARTYYEDCLANCQEIGDKQGIANSLGNLGNVASSQSDYAGARTYYEESLSIRQEISDKPGIAASLHNLGDVAYSEGDYAQARNHYQQSLTLYQEIGERRGMVRALEGFAALAANLELAITTPTNTAEATRKSGAEPVGSDLRWAARLWGAAQALREAIGSPLSPTERQQQEPKIAAAQARLGEADWTAAWNEGRAMTLEQAITYALAEENV